MRASFPVVPAAVRKVARLDTGCAAVLDRIPGSCVCGTEIGCGLDTERFTAQRKVSEVSQSVRRSPRVQTRRRERERETGGEEGVTADADNAILRCVFTSHMFYPNP